MSFQYTFLTFIKLEKNLCPYQVDNLFYNAILLILTLAGASNWISVVLNSHLSFQKNLYGILQFFFSHQSYKNKKNSEKFLHKS